MSVLAALALVSGLVCALAPLAQAARIATTRSARDVSVLWLAMYALGSSVWLGYGAAIGSLPLIVSQSVAFASMLVALGAALRYRADARSEAQPHRRAQTRTAASGPTGGHDARAPVPGRRSRPAAEPRVASVTSPRRGGVRGSGDTGRAEASTGGRPRHATERRA